MACSAVAATAGSAAACSIDSGRGATVGITRSCGAGTSSKLEYAPNSVKPNTWSPTAKPLSLPAQSTTPEKSNPGTMGHPTYRNADSYSPHLMVTSA